MTQVAYPETEPEKSIHHLENPDLWQYWPLQPVMAGNLNDGKIGVVMAVEGVRHVVFEANLFSGTNWREAALAVVEGREADIPVSVYDSFQAMMDDGWRVD